MSLDLPVYLASLESAQHAVKHRWLSGDDMVALGNETPALLKNIGEVSLRGVLGLQAALGEWVAARFRHFGDVSELTQVNEAVWAASIDFRYLRLSAMKFAAASGPVDGPIRECKMISKKICGLYPDAEFGAVRRAIGSANLVRYLLPDSKGFETWFKRVVQRLPPLSTPSARSAGFLDIEIVAKPPEGVSTAIFGTPIPREAYDPTFDLASADPASLIEALLLRIAAQPNPFLFSAAELTAVGFPGKPYRYPS